MECDPNCRYVVAQGETSLQMLGKQIDSQLMSNYWAHTWYLFKFLEQAILCHLKLPQCSENILH
ncbi:hypothetical protein T08_12962 [Trichinella sp. T8]|nr:hypothetical protein T08_12962 [Trichinella sp. T8]